MLSFSNFLRRLTRDAVLAGVEDAVRFLEPQATQDVPNRMVEQLEQRLKRLPQNRSPQAAISTQSAPHLPAQPNVEQASPPIALPKPESNGRPPGANEKKLPPRKRGPGRPKKQPHPHAD